MTTETIPTKRAASPGGRRLILISCSSCGEHYGQAAWQRLPELERIETPELRRFVNKWPESLVIEVRRCSACGRAIAAKRPAITV